MVIKYEFVNKMQKRSIIIVEVTKKIQPNAKRKRNSNTE